MLGFPAQTAFLILRMAVHTNAIDHRSLLPKPPYTLQGMVQHQDESIALPIAPACACLRTSCRATACDGSLQPEPYRPVSERCNVKQDNQTFYISLAGGQLFSTRWPAGKIRKCALLSIAKRFNEGKRTGRQETCSFRQASVCPALLRTFLNPLPGPVFLQCTRRHANSEGV